MATPATTNERIRKTIFMGALFLSNKLIYVMNKKITGFEASGIYNPVHRVYVCLLGISNEIALLLPHKISQE